MRSVRDARARFDLVTRVERLTPEGPRLWGRMDVGQMVAHLADQLRMAVGDIAVREAKGILRFPPMRYLFIHRVPWPKGRAKAPPESFTTVPTTFLADRAVLVELIERFAATPPDRYAPLHPVFGRMSPRDWDVLSHKHIDHHLRQFGV